MCRVPSSSRVAEGSEYPKAAYKDGGEDLIWGKPVQTRILASLDDEVEALAKGWRLHPIGPDPLDHDGDGKAGGSIDALDHKPTEELRELAAPLKLHHKTGRDKLLAALRAAQNGNS